MYNKRLKNEIKSHCTQCGVERTVAYWDDELEYYIYLCDEPPVCSGCMSNQDSGNCTGLISNTSKSSKTPTSKSIGNSISAETV